jgi:hypothetical protein
MLFITTFSLQAVNLKFREVPDVELRQVDKDVDCKCRVFLSNNRAFSGNGLLQGADTEAG